MGLVGLLPAGGKAERFGGLPKFLLPTPEGSLLNVWIERMKAQGVEQIIIGASAENRMIIERLVPRDCLVYLVNSSTMSETVLAARRWCGNDTVLLAMPDTFIRQPDGGLGGLRRGLADNTVVAGLFAVREWQKKKLGMCYTSVSVNGELSVTKIVDKPGEFCTATHAWGVLGWQPAFWEHIHPEDPHVGFAMVRAIAAGIKVAGCTNSGEYWDCGTPGEYFQLTRTFNIT